MVADVGANWALVDIGWRWRAIADSRWLRVLLSMDEVEEVGKGGVQRYLSIIGNIHLKKKRKSERK